MDNIEKVDLDHVDWKSSREFFESLGDELEKLDNHDESYNFTWVGKRRSIIEAGAPINKTLRPDVEASKDFDNTKNMLIVGDNLDALKLLQESYLGKIKMIYIDPPYNTGHDFVYHDNFTVKKDDYADASTGDDGVKLVSEDEFAENSKANGRFHSDWLNMIYPRLKLARNLLADDGVIFISIDDNEQANLKKVCDEVFSEDNFVGKIVWLKGNAQNDASNIQKNHEYILCYSKTFSELKIGENNIKQKKVFAEKGRFYYEGAGLTTGGAGGTLNNRPNLGYTIYYNETTDDKIAVHDYDTEKAKVSNDASVIYKDDQELIMKGYVPIRAPKKGAGLGRWTWALDKFNKEKERIKIKKTQNGYSVVKKEFIDAENVINTSEGLSTKITIESPLKSFIDVSSALGTKETVDLFDGKKFFEYPKTVNLIKKYASSVSDNNFTILDFFAGSGTTGHAVMDLNAEDGGGNRKYILVQLDEKTDETSEAKKAGYDTIDQITAERLRRAGDKIKNEHPEAKIDTGFRVFRIDSSNEDEDIRKPLGEIKQSDLFNAIDNVKKDRTPLDLLFGVVYASALPFDLKLETRKIGENTVYLYGYLDKGTGLVACFDDKVPEDTIKEIAKLKALTAAFKDTSFENSAEKINLSEHFRILSPDTKVKVL